MSILGLAIEPVHRITSRRAVTQDARPPRTNSTPIARPLSTRTRVAVDQARTARVRETDLLRGINECIGQTVMDTPERGVDRTGSPAEPGRTALEPLALPEAGQHVGERPTLRAQLRPFVEVRLISSGPNLAVDGAGTTQDLASAPVLDDPVARLAGLGRVVPVALFWIQLRESRRDTDERAVVLPTRLEEKHPGGGYPRSAGWPARIRQSHHRRLCNPGC